MKLKAFEYPSCRHAESASTCPNPSRQTDPHSPWQRTCNNPWLGVCEFPWKIRTALSWKLFLSPSASDVVDLIYVNFFCAKKIIFDIPQPTITSVNSLQVSGMTVEKEHCSSVWYCEEEQQTLVIPAGVSVSTPKVLLCSIYKIEILNSLYNCLEHTSNKKYVLHTGCFGLCWCETPPQNSLLDDRSRWLLPYQRIHHHRYCPKCCCRIFAQFPLHLLNYQGLAHTGIVGHCFEL